MNEIIRYGDGIDYTHSNDVVADAKLIIDSAQKVAHQAINTALVQRNWLLGMRIAEEDLASQTRSELYGKKIVPMLAEELTKEYGKGFTKSSLYQYVKFYQYFPEIVQTPSGQSFPRLSWSHYVELLRVPNLQARTWYEEEAIRQGWSVSALSRNISTQYYHRLLANHADMHLSPGDPVTPEVEKAERLAFIKNPMVVEFLGLPAEPELHESKLESAIIANLQQFLLELGKGYAFVARQQHIRTEWSDFYIDLVFYNYILKCFVLIDLKTRKIAHQDIGQMDMYVRMYDELKREENDGPTLGIVLCSETDEDIARYSVLHDSDQLFASKYKLYLPNEAELRAEIEEQKRIFQAQHHCDEDGTLPE